MRSRSNHAIALLLTFGLAFCQLSTRAAQPSGSADPVAQLQHDFDVALASGALEHGYWSVLARSLRTGETLYALNSHKLMMPASAMKIVTLAAAAERLGWDFTYETQIFAVGRVEDGVLDGDLLIVGSGDPSIVERGGMAAGLFESWAERLKGAGIRAITGRIVGDDTAFDNEALGFGWSWDDLVEGYAAGVSALQYNENRVQITIEPNRTVGLPPHVTVAPSGSDLIIKNLLKTSADRNPSISARRLPGSKQLELHGSMPLDHDAIMLAASVDNPTMFFVTALREALIGQGIDVRGPALEIAGLSDAPMRSDAVLLWTHRSAPLSAMMMSPFKFSLNLYEETLLKTMGAAVGTANFKAGRTAIQSTLQDWGISSREIIQADGSGLSRYNYVTADALVTVLTRIGRDSMMRGPFESSLPVAGRDGTLAGRMRGTSAEGNARAKTGAMSNVRALAGYVTAKDGEVIVFAILANNFEPPVETVLHTIDALVVRLADFRR
jgi:D-alanyl-D-alanine carboxypeptidase/D-alanyl-D-alanine-endopeptidase (penicillin-binding protein 4)